MTKTSEQLSNLFGRGNYINFYAFYMILFSIAYHEQIQLPLTLSSTEWTLALEQILLVLLITAKWLLPRGSLSRDQLAQLLMSHIGLAADSLEFSLESLKEQKVLCDKVLIVIILSIWSWSLLQFCINTTAVTSVLESSADEEGSRRGCRTACFSGDIWALLVSVILQDAPYLAMRLFLVVYVRAINQMILFFICKNILVISLQFYRLGILSCGNNVASPAEPTDDGDVPGCRRTSYDNHNEILD